MSADRVGVTRKVVPVGVGDVPQLGHLRQMLHLRLTV